MTENEDSKRLILALVLSVAVYGLWVTIVPQPKPTTPPPDAGATAQTEQGEKPAEGQPGADDQPGAEGAAKAAPALDPEKRQITTLTAEGRFALELSNLDGQVEAWSLLEDQYLKKAEGEEARPDRFLRPPSPVEPDSTFLPPALNLNIAGKPFQAIYQAQESEGAVTFTATDPASGATITRRYAVTDHPYVVEAQVTVAAGAQDVEFDLQAALSAAQNDAQSGGSVFQPPLFLFEDLCRHGETFEREPITSIRDDLVDPETPTRFTDGVQWAAVNNRYFMVGLIPGTQKDTTLEACDFRLGAEAAGVDPDTLADGQSVLVNLVDLTGGEVKAGETATRTVRFYAGPKKYESLGSLEPEMKEAVDFGWFTVISVPMLLLMRLFHEWFANWGLAIILLTVLVKILTLPLTHKQYKSMAAMKKVQPQMKALQEKYKDDRLKLQQEMMKLYKEHKVNPLAGCLPVVLMMPVYFALYRTIYSAVELYQADLGGWIHDLSQQDPYYILPLALGALMFVQTRLSPTTGDQMQAKIMMWVMPFMFTFMMLWLPSGLVLYIAANTLMGLVQQYWLLKKTNEDSAPVRAKASRA